MQKFNKEGIYKFRFMPNINNPQNYAIKIRISDKNNIFNSIKPLIYDRSVSYILIDNKIKACLIPRQLERYFNLFFTGNLSINSDNLIIGNRDVKYYSIDENNYISTYENDPKLPNIKNDLIYLSKPYSLFDIQNGYDIILKSEYIKDVGVFKHTNLSFIENDTPIWKEGDDKNIVFDMYKGVKSLEDYISKYIEENKKQYPDVLFNEEIDEFLKQHK